MKLHHLASAAFVLFATTANASAQSSSACGGDAGHRCDCSERYVCSDGNCSCERDQYCADTCSGAKRSFTSNLSAIQGRSKPTDAEIDATIRKLGMKKVLSDLAA